MPYRAEEPRELCAACDAFALGECERCGVPLCTSHWIHEELCQNCNDEWLVRSYQGATVPWGPASNFLATVARRSGVAASLFIALTMFVPELFGVLALVSLPVFLLSIAALPIARLTERGAAAIQLPRKKSFLEEGQARRRRLQDPG